MKWIFLLLMTLVVSCKSNKATFPAASCTSDSDCFVTADECCPSCCGGPVRATTPDQFAKDRAACKTDDCDAEKNANCDSKECAHAIDEFVAVCREGICAAITSPPPAPKAKGQCETNSDCVVSDFNCCPGCCHEVYAATLAQLQAAHETCAMRKCPKERDCSTKKCPPEQAVPDFDALCKENTCKAVLKRFGNTVAPNAQ